MVVDGDRGESRSLAVARRLREELAGRRISVSEVARRIGTTQQKLSRRMTGLTPWDVNELDEVCRAAGISFVYVTTGIREVPTPGGPDGGGVEPPAGIEPATYSLQGHRFRLNRRTNPSTIVPLPRPHQEPQREKAA